MGYDSIIKTGGWKHRFKGSNEGKTFCQKLQKSKNRRRKDSGIGGKIKEYNKEGDLHIQLVKDEPKAIDSRMAHFGKFSGVSNLPRLQSYKSNYHKNKNGSGRMISVL